jgi:hypothetical protein
VLEVFGVDVGDQAAAARVGSEGDAPGVHRSASRRTARPGPPMLATRSAPVSRRSGDSAMLR